MEVRELLIRAFQRKALINADLRGLSIAFSIWLEIRVPHITVTRPDAAGHRRFSIACDNHVDARKVSEEWGGNVTGHFVNGLTVDLTL